jgi:hypothetical protein
MLQLRWKASSSPVLGRPESLDPGRRGGHRREPCPSAVRPGTTIDRLASRRQLALQRRPKLLWRPPAKRPVDDQRWPVHPVGPTQHTGRKPEQPCEPVVLQLERRPPHQAVRGERDYDNGQDRLDDDFRDRCQQQQAQRDAEQRGQDQPPRTAEMDLVPVLHDDDGGDGDRDEDG